jgi:D-serine deaminase-like pyridoxal phosphate-dependent protein
VSSSGPAAVAARADIRELIGAKGHAVDNARAVIARLDDAFATGALVRTPSLAQSLADLDQALDQDEGMKLGGKSAEAARFIMRAIDRELDNA